MACASFFPGGSRATDALNLAAGLLPGTFACIWASSRAISESRADLWFCSNTFMTSRICVNMYSP